jgi:hypothetical protein
VGLIFGLMIPACGYFGAKQNSKELLMWFTGCNVCVFVLAIISLTGSYSAWQDGETEVSESGWNFYVVITVLAIILNFFGFVFGAELNSKRQTVFTSQARQFFPPAPPAQQPQISVTVNQGGGYPPQQPQMMAPQMMAPQMQYVQQPGMQPQFVQPQYAQQPVMQQPVMQQQVPMAYATPSAPQPGYENKNYM